MASKQVWGMITAHLFWNNISGFRHFDGAAGNPPPNLEEGVRSTGVTPPTSTWGAIIAEGRNSSRTRRGSREPPGLAILVTVLAFKLLGDGFCDALDPRPRGELSSVGRE
jgi:hypothetical protein